MDELISKQAAVDLVRDVCDAIISCCGSHYDEETDDEVYDDIREIDAILKCNKEIRIALKNMPSAQPERIKGHWILAKEQRREDTENDNYMYNCSNCDCGDLHSKAVKVSYCWNCGAEMEVTT